MYYKNKKIQFDQKREAEEAKAEHWEKNRLKKDNKYYRRNTNG